MNQTEATHLIREVFEQPFDEARFSRFVRELLNEIDESKATRLIAGQYIPLSYREHVQQYRRLATYTDPDGQAVDILLVQLKKSSGLERARTVQRNFVAHHLKNRDGKDAALVAYVGDDRADWRFSLVRMDYRLHVDGDSGKVKVAEDLTPARRYSFLVGQHEPNHTAQQQLFPILADDRHNPTLADLENAFNIESVTREFFRRYKELFLLVREEVDGILARQPAARAEFQGKGIDSETFAKKLLGQIVFLYFLQKKGWLGVAPGQPWGSGPRSFLRQLFDGRWGRYGNFFDEVLEPLFYEALAVERPDNLYGRLGCRIPFLNGGLFEPVGGYDWEGCPVPLSNATVQAIFDAFDLYNFTVREDEPLEKEVAVDPEMLGKVFENLLEVRDRKSKGAFYTPREIVHYMCQEALIHYLDAALNLQERGIATAAPGRPAEQGPRVPREDIERFIRQGELAVEHEAARAEGASSYKRRLPASVAEHAAALDKALAGVKICDPAIGSGAFPVGVMQEIVRGRGVLNAYLGDHADRTAYAFKRHAIQESIYGVDIDPSAVDIAKLRLWLSLVVDEEDYHSIKPLPNLGYKIVCGNSLLSVQKDLFNQHLFARIEELKEQYFVETSRPAKQAQSREIDALIGQLTHAAGQFDYEVWFSEVFRAQDGFDVVIGNPPYVRQELIREHKPALKAHFPEVYQGTADLYVYFYAKGLRLLRPHGVLVYISSNKFMRAGYGERLRRLLAGQTSVQTVIDFGDLPVFDATTYPTVLVLRKAAPAAEQATQTLVVEEIGVVQRLVEEVKERAWVQTQTSLKPSGWTLVPPVSLQLMAKLRHCGVPLSDYVEGRFLNGVKTGLNEAFVVDEATRSQLLSEDPRSIELIKPWLRGRDIARWIVRQSGRYLLYVSWDCPIQNYPAIMKHLANYRESLVQRDGVKDDGPCPWYALSRPRPENAWSFARPKIVYPHFNTMPNFAYDTVGSFSNDKTYIIPDASKFLLGVLNSGLTDFFLKQLAPSVQQGYMEFRTIYVGQVPVPSASADQEAAVTAVVDKLVASKGQGPQVAQWEGELNALVYELYGLTGDEIAIVEHR